MKNKKVIIIVVIVIIIIAAAAGSGGENKYDTDLKNGVEKYYSGEKMTQDEYNAVKNMKNWSEKNSTKTYADWDS